ncbi:MAG: TonB-dependent receptor [Bryobacteraceae bacterium]
MFTPPIGKVMADSVKLRAHLSRPARSLIPLAMFLAGACLAGDTPPSPSDLADASLETLMNLEVSSPSRQEQKLGQTASAVYVITQDDIRRSGMSSIPELLRMVPGVQVARIDASSWSVTARGFAGQFADKMLVMIDGRSIYNHLNAGVYWEQNAVPLNDIERIEAIRGPGATMWGANAMNGVINIITKPARETQGLAVETGGGSEERASGSMRYGGAAGNRVSYRAYADYFQDGPLSSAGQAAYDRWDSAQGGGRLDWQTSDRDTLSLEGNIYRGAAQETVYPDYPAIGVSPPVPDSVALSGEYALGRWTHRFSERSELAMQFSLSDEDRVEQGLGRLSAHTADFDFQHHFAYSAKHDLMWGFDAQIYQDGIRPQQTYPEPSATVLFVPADSTELLASLFLQDRIALLPERLTLTVGAKLEQTGYSGFDIQPSARLLWNATPRQGLWASVSRAVHNPALAERDVLIEYQLAPNAGVQGLLSGNKEFQPETALTYEAGYRVQPARWLTADLATFFGIYHDLASLDSGAPFLQTGPPAVLVAPMQFGNGAAGHTYGIELATNWSVTRKWRLTGNYSWFRYGLDRAQLAAQSIPTDIEGSSPAHQVQFRSQWDIGTKLNFDTGIYFVSALPGLYIPGYVRTDARLGWRVTRAAEISLVGQNLLNGSHLEFAPTYYTRPTAPGRAVQLKVAWAF